MQSLTRRLGHQKWFAATMRLLVPADRLVGRLTQGRVVAFGLVPSLVLTTTGRRSGKPRSNPLLYVPDGDAYVVIGSNWGQPHQPAWSLNLLAQPAAEVDVKGRRSRCGPGRSAARNGSGCWQLLVASGRPTAPMWSGPAAGRSGCSGWHRPADPGTGTRASAAAAWTPISGPTR